MNDNYDAGTTISPIVHDWEWWSRFLQIEYYASKSESRTWKRTVRQIQQELNLQPGERFLDLGSGSGELVLGLAERGVDAVGVELFGSLVAACREKGRKRGLAATFIQADLFTWKPETKFDGIASINTSFGYGSDAENRALIENTCRWLRPGGRFYLDTLVADEAESFGLWKDELAGGTLQVENEWDEARSTMISHPWWIDGNTGTIHTADRAEEVRIYSIAEIEKMLDAAGFRFRRLRRGAGRRAVNESGVNSMASWLALR